MPDELPELTIVRGTCYPLFAYDVAQAIDLDGAERRILAGTERQTVKQKRRAPAFFEYRPAPLRVSLPAQPLSLGGGAFETAPLVEVVLYDFGAVSLSYTIPLGGPLGRLAPLSQELWGNERLLADSRRQMERVVATLGDAAVRPGISDFVEDYAIFEIEQFTPLCDASVLVAQRAQTIAQVLRAEPRTLSQQEIADATASRLSFGPDDATFIDTDATVLFDPEGEDVRAVIEFANTQLLEMRYLDQQLDDALDRAYGLLSKRRWAPLRVPSLYGADLRELAELQLDAAYLFEQVTNALKLIGEQYLTRVYGLASRRFHLAEWDVSIGRKLQTIDSIYSRMSDRAATRRMELLEWIIILLFLVSIAVSVVPALMH